MRSFAPPPIAILLAGLGYWLATTPYPFTVSHGPAAWGADSSTPDKSDTAELPLAFDIPAVQNHSMRINQLSERPLFSENRRNQQETVPEDEPELVVPDLSIEPVIVQPPKAPSLVFRGFVDNDGTTEALVFDFETQSEQWIKVGQSLLEWQVTEINKNRINLERNGFIHVVEFNR